METADMPLDQPQIQLASPDHDELFAKSMYCRLEALLISACGFTCSPLHVDHWCIGHSISITISRNNSDYFYVVFIEGRTRHHEEREHLARGVKLSHTRLRRCVGADKARTSHHTYTLDEAISLPHLPRACVCEFGCDHYSWRQHCPDSQTTIKRNWNKKTS